MRGSATLHRIFSERTGWFLTLLVAGFFLLYRVAGIFFPHPDAGGVEGNVIYFVQRILDGQPVYTDPEQPPFAIAQYAPAYYYLVAGIARVSGSGPDEVFALFVVGRVVSLLLNIGLARIVLSICRKIFDIPVLRSGITAGLCFIFLQSTSFARPDSLYHVVFMLSLYCFLRWFRQEASSAGRNWLVAAALLSAATFFCKQTGIVLPCVFGLILIIQKRYKLLVQFSLFYLVTFSAMFAVTGFFLGFDLFLKNALQGINNGISPGWYLRVVFLPVFASGAGFLLLPAFVIVLWLALKETRPALRLSGSLLLLFFICLNGIALKLGSVAGYLTEWWIFLFIQLAYYWPVFTRKRGEAVAMMATTVFVLILGIKTWQLMPDMQTKWKALTSSRRMEPYFAEKKLAGQMLNRVPPGKNFAVFMNMYTPDSYMSNLLFRQAVLPQFEIVTISTYPLKKYDYTRLEQGLQNGRFPWMMMREKDTVKRFFNIPLNHYNPVESAAGFTIYQFKP